MSARHAAALACTIALWPRLATAEPRDGAPARTDLLAAALDARSAGRLDAAERLLRDRLLELPSDTAARRELALTLAWRRAFTDAIAQYRQVLRGAPDDDAAAIGLARTLAWAGHHAASRAQLHAHLRQHPGSAEAWAALGATELAARNGDAAEHAYRRALALDGESTEAEDGLERLQRELAPRLALRAGTAIYPSAAGYASVALTWPSSLRTQWWARAATVAEPDVGTGATAAVGAVHRSRALTAAAGVHLLDAPGLTGLAESSLTLGRGAWGALLAAQLRIGDTETTGIVRLGVSVQGKGLELAAQGIAVPLGAASGALGADLAVRFEDRRLFLEGRVVLADVTSGQAQARIAVTSRLAVGARATTRAGVHWLGGFTEIAWP